MSRLNFQRPRHYALARLANNRSPALRYHSLAQAHDDVALAAERLAWLEGINELTLLLLRIAGSYHDIGFVVQRAASQASGMSIIHC